MESPAAKVNWKRCLLAMAGGPDVDEDFHGDEEIREREVVSDRAPEPDKLN